MTAPTAAFAQVADLVARWRPLIATEFSRAAVLLGDAAIVIRTYPPGIDGLLTSGAIPAGAPLMVSCRMVRRALEQESTVLTHLQAGPFVREFANPDGNLYILREEFRMLGLSPNIPPVGSFPPAPLVDPFNRYGSAGNADPYPGQWVAGQQFP